MNDDTTEKTYMEVVNNPGKLLLDSGLLGEINRTVLHPRGLAMYVQTNDDGTSSIGIYDDRECESGTHFDDATITSIATKLLQYDAMNGQDTRVMYRLRKLGYVVQK